MFAIAYLQKDDLLDSFFRFHSNHLKVTPLYIIIKARNKSYQTLFEKLVKSYHKLSKIVTKIWKNLQNQLQNNYETRKA